MSGETDLQQLSRHIESLVQRIEGIGDPSLRADVLTLIQSIMDLHGAGLKRVLDLAAEAGEQGRFIINAVAADELAGSLLLLHGLHPAETEQRVAAAVEKLQRGLRSQSVMVTLIEVRDGTVRVRLEQTGKPTGCGSTQMALRRAVEDAIYSAAPDVASVEIQDIAIGHQPLVQLQLNSISAKA